MRLILLACAAALPLAAAAQPVPQPVPDPLPPGNTLPQTAVLPQPQATANGTVPHMDHLPATHMVVTGPTQEFSAEMDRMMAAMNQPYTGDTDHDFVTHMLPHHQAAVEMAETELKYGHDPKLKQLAGRIIAAQQREIAFMEAWLAKHPLRQK